LKSRSYRTCEFLARQLERSGRSRFTRKEVTNLIQKHAGGGRTIDKYLRMLFDFEFLKTSEHIGVFKLKKEAR